MDLLSAGPFLIDTGLHRAAGESIRRAYGHRAAVLFNIRMEDGAAVTDRLLARGLDPLGIDYVVMTHMHYDHTGSVEAFPHSTFVVDEREWEAVLPAATVEVHGGGRPGGAVQPAQLRLDR